VIADVVDSYFDYVTNQMAKIDSSQKFGSMIEARDWPMTPPIEGALYLLYMHSLPVGGTEAQIEYEHFCQWTWILIGTDITGTQQAANRGDRRRQNAAIINNLRQANFPSYCQKKSYAMNGNTVEGTGVSSTVPYSSSESIFWSHLRFLPRPDLQKTGLIYGAAQVSVYAWEDVAVAVA
jgi:hypothetical protein